MIQGEGIEEVLNEIGGKLFGFGFGGYICRPLV